MIDGIDTDDSFQRSLIASLALHVGVMLFLYFGAPNLFHADYPNQIHPYVPIDIVEIGELTNLNTGKETDPQPSNAPAPKPKETPPTEPEKKQPPKEMPKTSIPDKIPTPDEIALKVKKDAAKTKTPETPKEKPQADPLASVLKNVAKLKETQKGTEQSQEKASPTSGTSGGINAPSYGDRLTISEEDALRRQISQCWNMPVGARNSEELIVEVLIEVNPDRTVRDAKIVDQFRMTTDGYFRAAAEAALRALRHPNCSPLILSPDKYEQWKTIHFTFDPRDML